MERRILAAITRCILVATLVACGALPTAAQWRRYVDIRPIPARASFTAPDESVYWVILAAREGVPGHAYVMWAYQDHARKLTGIEAFGFHPTVTGVGAAKSAVGPVPGALLNEIVKKENEGCCSWSSPDAFVVVRVDKDVYDKADAVRKEWNEKANQYQLTEQDCVTFMIEAGESIGLDMPGRSLTNSTPALYMRSVIRTIADGDMKVRINTKNPLYKITPFGPSSHTAGTVYVGMEAIPKSVLGFARERQLIFPITAPGDRPRRLERILISGKLVQDSEWFDDGDVFHEAYSGYYRNRYIYRNGFYVENISSPDRRNARPEQFGEGSYQGDWKRNLPNGKGTWRSNDGKNTYSGDWRDGRPHGKGETVWPNGHRYKGEFASGSPHGNGTYRWPDGSEFTGTFKNGSFGKGTMKDASGQQRAAEGRDHADRRAADGDRGTRADREGGDSDMRGKVVEYDSKGEKIGEKDIGGMDIEVGEP